MSDKWNITVYRETVHTKMYVKLGHILNGESYVMITRRIVLLQPSYSNAEDIA